jgi:2-hydroxychromene-2-carboxylate isomerase
MKQITFYLDFISPYAYLAFHELPLALQGLSYTVIHKPLMFAALLKHYGTLGPAEIRGKREWTYRQVQWLGHSKGIALDMPATHPFNPLGLLRLAVAADAQGTPNRYVCETIFRHVWQGGANAADAARLAELTAELEPVRDANDDSVKVTLKSNADDAIAAGVFGVPSFEVDGKVFWGLDALPMLRSYLDGDAWFSNLRWNSADALPSGVPPRNV